MGWVNWVIEKNGDSGVRDTVISHRWACLLQRIGVGGAVEVSSARACHDWMGRNASHIFTHSLSLVSSLKKCPKKIHKF